MLPTRATSFSLALAVLLSACATPPGLPEGRPGPPGAAQPPSAPSSQQPPTAESPEALAGGRKVLATARRMIERGVIIRGSCWDFVNAVYTRAGFPNRRGKRAKVFKSKRRGPYADVSQLRPGDWVYHVNHSYRGVPHSGIFVRWVDRRARLARMASYAGGRRRVPARYRDYDLSSVYAIFRPAP